MPSKDGATLELFVDAKYRKQKVGTALMRRMEEHFKEKGCNASRVEVFDPIPKHTNSTGNSNMLRAIFMTKKL